ncbi:Uncharacterised protein [Mycobacteroides abscessus subsp. massiliense]|nr:Uncharacterised protein [Mycobacteroides abscessus subsp. massiliense]
MPVHATIAPHIDVRIERQEMCTRTKRGDSADEVACHGCSLRWAQIHRRAIKKWFAVAKHRLTVQPASETELADLAAWLKVYLWAKIRREPKSGIS